MWFVQGTSSCAGERVPVFTVLVGWWVWVHSLASGDARHMAQCGKHIPLVTHINTDVSHGHCVQPTLVCGCQAYNVLVMCARTTTSGLGGGYPAWPPTQHPHMMHTCRCDCVGRTVRGIRTWSLLYVATLCEDIYHTGHSLQCAVSNMCMTVAAVANVGHFIVACAWELHAL